ncbi:MAG: DUF3516 domain-containing protein [Oligoflexia bacterium]|nr:DUF3516 domain-containing protein [Oligoflexia bacterium]
MPAADWPLQKRLASGPDGGPDLLDRFLDYVREKGLELYPAQEEAILELYSGKNVILNTPTGSGKSLVATALHFEGLAQGRRSVYTCPIKALVNEKFLQLCRDFGPEQVGMITGDASVNPGAPIICCTAEILANDALRHGADAPVEDAILDEFHFYADRERGVAWQLPLLALKKTRFLLMSATLGDTERFEKALTALNGRETVVVRSGERPVPLDFEYRETPLHETITDLVVRGLSPVYLVNFTQRECAEQAQNLLSTDFCTKDEKRAITEALYGSRFSSPYGHDVQKLLKHGVGIHHAGLLPRYRVLVEKLAQKGLLKVICGTDTLGVGVNVPIRTVLFTKLCKFDGEKTTILSVRDFQQIAGRAGRRGFDTRGAVVVQAPEHVIENLRMEQKAGGDAKKLRKFVKRKPPEKGFLPWNLETFQRLSQGQPEALVSRFRVSHGMLLQVLGRENEDGCRAMRELIRASHEGPGSQKSLRRTAFQLFRSLVEKKIITLGPLRVNVDLQEDFSLNHALSLYLVDTLERLDPESPDYALNALTLVESILENPELVLRKQLDRLKGEKVRELKELGMEYEERMEELEKLEYPKPNRDFIYATFNEFAARHPWVGQENIRPKSIAREMYENFQGFGEYIRDYELQRAEGLLLRYLSDVYKTLVQTVPDYAKNEELFAMIDYFGSMLRTVDSSLLDEWEKLRDPLAALAPREETPPDHGGKAPKQNRKAFTIQLRNEIFRFLRALSCRDFALAATWLLPPQDEPEWNAERLERTLKEYEREHGRLRTDTPARGGQHTQIDSSAPAEWIVTQTLVDAEGHNDWEAVFGCSPDKPGLRLIALGPIGAAAPL